MSRVCMRERDCRLRTGRIAGAPPGDGTMMSSANAGREGGSDVSVAPSVSNSITVRLDVPSRGRAVSELTHAVEQAGGAGTALNPAPFGPERPPGELAPSGRHTDHAQGIVSARSAIARATLVK